MPAEIDLSIRLQAVIAQALDNAAKELGLGLGSLDVSKLERLECLVLRLVSEGEQDSEALAARAVAQFRNSDSASTG